MSELGNELANHLHHRVDDTGTVDGTLLIETNNPVTVLIAKFVENGKTVAGFAASPSGPFYRGGVHWKIQPDDYALFINFQFMPGVKSVDCDDLLYSIPYGALAQNQFLSVPPPVDVEVKYDFFVDFTTGERHDPKILVTPITTAPGCG
jgi:hypothetical protein